VLVPSNISDTRFAAVPGFSVISVFLESREEVGGVKGLAFRGLLSAVELEDLLEEFSMVRWRGLGFAGFFTICY
jgi:hypothetical protein